LVHHVVAIVTSSGGAAALRKVFAKLPGDLPAAVVVARHLSVDGHHALPSLGSAGFSVEWATTGARLQSGQVLVAPPGMWLHVGGSGSCQVGECPGGALDHPFDVLLTSLATSFGPKVIAIVLTGSLDDGAAGACAVRKAGGTVVVQTEESASHPSMPRAAIAADGADLVVPLDLIGTVTAQLISPDTQCIRPASDWRAVEAGRRRAQARATVARSRVLRERAAVRREQMAAARTVSQAKLTEAATRHAVVLLRSARQLRELARLTASAHHMAADAAVMALEAQKGHDRAEESYRLALAKRREGTDRPSPSPRPTKGARLGARPEGMVRK
jgi:hypothetical protein